MRLHLNIIAGALDILWRLKYERISAYGKKPQNIFPIKEGLVKRTVGYVKAVEDVSFSVKQKQVYAIVGESIAVKALG